MLKFQRTKNMCVKFFIYVEISTKNKCVKFFIYDEFSTFKKCVLKFLIMSKFQRTKNV